jgi:D-sedoheptulose 7-phosphate isomerase
MKFMLNIIRDSLEEASHRLQIFLHSESNLKSIEDAAAVIVKALKTKNKIISCGDGGSLCDATHFAEELTGKYRNDRVALPAISINDPAYITCVGNDYSFSEIYSRYVDALGQEGDVLLAISTSGCSENVLKASKAARKKGMAVVCLTSDTDNPLRKESDISICAPKSDYSDRIQEIHIKVIHILIQLVEKELKIDKL